MSGSSNTSDGQQNVGTLLRRMTLASLGLDDLAGVDQEGREALQSADRFAERIDRHVQRLEHVGAQIRVLPGMPDFVVGVQERYVPLHVDTEFGLAPDTSGGPRNHTDIGAWYKLLDAVHLVLFDEDEGDYVVKARGVTPRAVRSAVTQMARRSVRPPRSLFGDEQRPARTALSAPRRASSDILSMSPVASQAFFGRGPSLGTSAAAHERRFERGTRTAQPTDERVFARADAWGDAARDVNYAGLPGVRALERAAMAQAIMHRHDAGVGGAAAFARPDRASAIGVGLLGGLRSVRPLGSAPSHQRGVGAGATVGFNVEQRLSSMARTGEGTAAAADATRFDPRAVDGRAAVASLSELGGVQRDGYRYMGASSGSLLALVPESLEREALDALYAQRGSVAARRRTASRPLFEDAQGPLRVATANASSLTPYPAGLGRAGAMLARLLEQNPGTTPGHTTAARALSQPGAMDGQPATRALREQAIMRAVASGDPGDPALAGMSAAQLDAVRRLHARGSSQTVRHRLADYARLPGTSGALLQSLADEPTVRALAAIAPRTTSPTRAGRLLEALLSREPALPSSLGFEPRDLIAPFEGELGRALSERLTHSRSYRRRFLDSAVDLAEPVRRVEGVEAREPGARAREALQLARGAALSTPSVIERAALRLDAERRVSTAASSSVYGDVTVDGSYLRGLTASLHAVFRSLERAGQSAAGGAPSALEAGGSSHEEATFARLDRMLSVVRAGGVETGELRAAVRALRRAGQLTQTSRLAWLADEPVMLSGAERGKPENLRRLLQSGLRPQAVAEAARQGVAVLASNEVVPPTAASTDATLARRLDRFADVARMFSLPRAAQLLAPELVEAARPLVADMLRESIRGELRRHVERQAAVMAGRTSPSTARHEAVALALGRPTLSDADAMVRDGAARITALGALGAEHAAGGRWTAASVTMRRLGESRGADGRLDLLTGFGGSGFDSEQVAVSMRHRSAAQHRNALSLRSDSHGQQGAAQGSVLEPRLSVRLDTASPAQIGANATRAEHYEPRVLGLARFEERVAAELSAASGQRVLRTLDDEPRALRLFSEPGEVVRVSYSPDVLARMVAAESQRKQALASVTPEAIAAGRLNEAQRRAIARSVLGVERVEVFEKLAGAPLTQADPVALMKIVDEARRGAVPIQALQGALRDALGGPMTNRAALSNELQRRIAGLDLAGSTRSDAVGVVYRELEQAMDRFSLARASSAGHRRAGYFEALVPGGFDASAPSRQLASAYGAPLQELIAQRAARMRGADAQQLRRLPIEELRLSGAALEHLGERGREAPLELRLRDAAGAGTYEVVRASNLSRVLGRFAQEPAALAEARGAAPRARFVSRAGEPGDLGSVLETFVPAAAAVRRAGFFSAQRALMEPVLSQRARNWEPGDGGSRRSDAAGRAVSRQASVSHSLDVLRHAGGDALLGALGEQVASRMAEQGASLHFVEAPTGLTDVEIKAMFDIGSGDHAARQASRHDDVRMLRRVEEFLGRARTVSERATYFGGSPGDLAAVARHLPAGRPEQGMPSWSGPSAEKVRGVALGELREMLRQVGAVPVQGGELAPERALVDPSGGAGNGAQGQPAPLFSAREETMPSNQVRNREQATRTSDTGKPSASDLEIFANAVYDLIKERLRDQLFRARST